MSVSLVHPGDSRKQAEAVLNKPLETTQLKKNLVKPETVSSYIHHLKLYISPAKALQRERHTHTHLVWIFLLPIWEFCDLIYGSSDKESVDCDRPWRLCASALSLCLSLIFNIMAEVWIPIKACLTTDFILRLKKAPHGPEA